MQAPYYRFHLTVSVLQVSPYKFHPTGSIPPKVPPKSHPTSSTLQVPPCNFRHTSSIPPCRFYLTESTLQAQPYMLPQVPHYKFHPTGASIQSPTKQVPPNIVYPVYSNVCRKIGSYSDLFTFLVRWQASAVSWPPSDIIFAQLACPLNDIIFLFHQE